MHSFSRVRLQVAYIAMLMTLPGCATFSVDDAYRPLTPGKQDFIEVVADDAKSRVSFVPETRFFSTGLLVPMVPLGVSSRRGQDVEMEVLATVPSGLPFSFAPVCLEAPSSRLCPRQVQVGIAYYDGEQTQHGPAFVDWNQPEPWEIDATAAINDQDVFKHRPFRGVGVWATMQLELTYRYTCEGTCPDEVSLPFDELLRLQERSFDAGPQRFRWRRKTDFEQVIVQ